MEQKPWIALIFKTKTSGTTLEDQYAESECISLLKGKVNQKCHCKLNNVALIWLVLLGELVFRQEHYNSRLVVLCTLNICSAVEKSALEQ